VKIKNLKIPEKINFMNTKVILLFLVSLSAIFSRAQDNTDNLFLRDRLQPVNKDNFFKTEGYFNWGASIIKGKDGQYHMFYARWEKEYSFLGWLTHSEIAHAVSKTPYGPWKYKNTVLKGREKGHWDAITAHNPKIKFFEGKYYLYYISTNMGKQDYNEEDLIETARTGYEHKNWKILRPNQRTGVAVSENLDGPWIRQNTPLIEPSGPITTLTVNPAIDKGKDGQYYLVVKGDKPNEERFIRNQAVAISEKPNGPFTIMPDPVIDYIDTEDVSIWYDQGRNRFYGIFHSNDDGSFIGMITSSDGIKWEKAADYWMMPKKVRLEDCTYHVADRLERPFVFYEDGEPRVLSLAARKGNESYNILIPIKNPEYPLPNKNQLAWQEAEMGALISYDLHVFDNVKYRQADNRIEPVDDYQIFNPQNLDTDQWIKAIKDAGFKFAILTATHETGFALYQSEVNPYCMKALRYKDGKGDVVRDFVESCRKYGIKPGIYLGIRWNSFYGVHNFQVNGTGDFKLNRQKHYNEMVEGMVKEICTNYGELFEIWFDGGADHPDNGAPDVLPIVRRYQPNCLFYHNKQYAEARWGGSESGIVPYPCYASFPYHYSHAGDTEQDRYYILKHGDPDGKYWMPAMSDAPLRGYNGRHEWFWEPGDEEHIYPLEDLMEMYNGSVGHNSTLITGLTPGPDGLLPEPDVKRLREWGAEIERRFSVPLASTSGTKTKMDLKLKSLMDVSQIVLKEDIRKGERIRSFKVEALVKNRWVLLCEGSVIGHKFISVFDSVTTNKVRLTINEAIDTPQIKSFAVYHIK
jgi:alpha-L-fucosidase